MLSVLSRWAETLPVPEEGLQRLDTVTTVHSCGQMLLSCVVLCVARLNAEVPTCREPQRYLDNRFGQTPARRKEADH